MKVNSLFIIASALLNSIECSGSEKILKKKISKYAEPKAKVSSSPAAAAAAAATNTITSPVTTTTTFPPATTTSALVKQAAIILKPAETSSTIPIHRLLGNLPVLTKSATKIGAHVIIESSDKPFESDDESLQSISDDDQPVKKSTACNKRKRSNFALSSDEESGAEGSSAPISTTGKNAAVARKSKRIEAAPKGKKTSVASGPKALKIMTEEIFAREFVTNFVPYFDENNSLTVGVDFLRRCFVESRYLTLARFLILNGVRMPVDDEIILSNIQAMQPYDISTTVSQLILIYYMEVDPVEATRLFIAAADKTENIDNAVDMIMFGLLVNNENIGAIFVSNPEITRIIGMLMQSGHMNTTLNFVLSQKSLDFLKDAIEQEDKELVSRIISGGFVPVTQLIDFYDRKQTVICHLFGKFDFKFIADLISTCNYPLNFSHDTVNNPNGDIIIAAVIAKDIDAFKGLLRLGASYDCKIRTKSSSQTSLESFLSSKSNYAEYYKALRGFKSQQVTERS